MSSIFGIINFDGKPVDKELVDNTLSRLGAGNSDFSGSWINQSVAVGQTTFWTTPESINEQQPVKSKDSSLILVADARIDNRADLLEKLYCNQEKTIITDAELILLSFIKWQERCTDHLVGDYSFVVYNKITREIFIARDHLGFRPLYYFQSDKTFAFCSKIQPLFDLNLVSRELDKEAFDYSLLFDAIPKHSTYYRHVNRFVGGHYNWLRNNQLTSVRYWKPEEYELHKNVGFNEATEEFLEIFEIAVKARLRSAYPTGFELSGGLDSSSVALIAHKIGMSQDWFPLSLRFGSMPCDEGRFIDAANQILQRQSIEVSADELDLDETYTLPWFYQDKRDWPADLFFIPHLVLASKASDVGVRTLLSGQGGDEVMQGSRWVYHDYLQQLRPIRALQELSHSRGKKHDFLRYFVRPQVPSPLMKIARSIKHTRYSSNFRHALSLRREMYSHLEFKEEGYSCKTAWDTMRMLNDPEAALWRDSNPYNLESTYSIEVRHPFFDVRLITLRLSLPANYFYHNGEYKVLLRKAMKNILPESILLRQDKAEFGTLVNRQLSASKQQSKDVNDTLESIISPLIWQSRQSIHAKCGFHDKEKALEWKLLNMYCWIKSGNEKS